VWRESENERAKKVRIGEGRGERAHVCELQVVIRTNVRACSLGGFVRTTDGERTFNSSVLSVSTPQLWFRRILRLLVLKAKATDQLGVSFRSKL
jgi:hypothetical protein